MTLPVYEELRRCDTPGFPRKGEWRPISKTPSGARGANISCPSCGKLGTLWDHVIEADGKVQPSVECPHPPCEFHSYIQLTGWEKQ